MSKMVRNQRDRDLPTKQEGDRKLAPPTSSRMWSGLKNPRIVRVSRAFGGKDRHSKVTTVRGLRDRRVRLSVPTAIQLYDLQERLGLNQPSKVVDWLLNAAQHEIDKLPPLQIPPTGFLQLPHDAHRPRADDESPGEKGNAVKDTDDALVSSVSGFSTMPYASYYQWEAANAYLSQIGIRSSQSTSDQAPAMPVPSSRPPAFDSPIVFCPPGIMAPMFQSNIVANQPYGQLQAPQSDLEINSLQLGSKPISKPFPMNYDYGKDY